MKLLFLSRDIVGTHNPHFVTSGHHSRENTTEGVQATSIISWYHLAHTHHEWSLYVLNIMYM